MKRIAAVAAAFLVLLTAWASSAKAAVNYQSVNYTIAPGDCGGVIYETGAFTTITLPATSGFSEGCVISVKNGHSSRAQQMAGFPSDLQLPNANCGAPGSFCLFPQQFVSVEQIGGEWATLVNPGRWRQYAPAFFVDLSGNGANDANDCLSFGAGACATIQHAVDLACFATDAGNTDSQVNIANGTYSGGAQLTTHCLGQNSVQIIGNPSSPGSIRIQQGSGAIFYAKDKGFLTLNGMILQPTASAVTPVSCGQHSNFDLTNVIVLNTPGATIFSATDDCTINLLGANYIEDNTGASSAVAFINVQNDARIQNDGTLTITGNWTVNYGCFAQANGVFQNAGSIVVNGSVAAQKYLAQLNGTIYGGAVACPGNVAGIATLGGQAN